MHVVADGPVMLFEDIPVGAVFYWQQRDVWHLCLKGSLRAAKEEAGIYAIALTPAIDGHQPATLPANHPRGSQVIHLVDAQLVLKRDDAGTLRGGEDQTLGRVFCLPNGPKIMIVPGDNNMRMAVDLYSGVMDAIPDLRRAIVYRAWSVVIPRTDREDVLLGFPPSA